MVSWNLWIVWKTFHEPISQYDLHSSLFDTHIYWYCIYDLNKTKDNSDIKQNQNKTRHLTQSVFWLNYYIMINQSKMSNTKAVIVYALSIY